VSRWFRWYEGTSEDGKFRVVARLSRVTVRDVIALWAFILEDAAHLDHRGVCKRNEDFMASILDFDDGVVERILDAMESAGMISVGHGDITICNWDKRQFEGDADPTAAERQRRKRERDKTVSNEPVTRDSRPPDTDTDTDTEKKDIVRKKSGVEEITDHFETWYQAYPLHKGRGAALKAYKAAILKTEIDLLLFAAKAFGKQMHGREKNFIPHPATWLNGQRWLDEDLQPPKPQEPMSNGQIYVKYGTEAGDAWEAYHRTVLHKPPPRDTKGGWYFPTEFPEPIVQRETSLPMDKPEAA
jgi:hypothetical protein